MTVLTTVDEVRGWRSKFQSVALVPTMGAFHQGHLSLMERGKEICDHVSVSLFVNPLQFGEGEDLANYPQREAQDIQMAESVGVDMIFIPNADELTSHLSTNISVTGVTDYFEGEKRPGHFDGVATIVTKLFNIVQPDTAIFGLKDLQQCALIKKFVNDLNIPVDLDFRETVREVSGLALSSRNGYFDERSRQDASALYRVLVTCAKNVVDTGLWVQNQDKSVKELTSLGFEVEYLEMVNPEFMTPIDTPQENSRLVVAAKFRGVRLIDNIPLDNN